MNDRKDLVYMSPVATEYRYYLDTSVTDTEHYQELFELLHNAGENDCVRIIISNFGGSLVTCLAIVNAIRSSKAMTVGVLASVAYSAGGVIWLACERQEVQQHVGFMGHDGQGSSFGSLYQQKQSIEHEMVMLRSLYEDIYKYFLTQEEIEVLLKNGDLWLNEQEIVTRLEKRQELYEAEDAAKAVEQQKQLTEMFDEEEPVLPDTILNKLTKPDLVNYIKGNIDVKILENGKFEIVVIDN